MTATDNPHKGDTQMTARKPVRQGDVLLWPVDEIPAAAKPVPQSEGPIILAYGETTGHAHGIYGRAAMFRDDGAGNGGVTYIEAEPGAMLGHGTPTKGLDLPRDPDHGPIEIGGKWRVSRQQEFPRGELARQVVD